MCHSTVAMDFSLVCYVSLYSGCGFHSVMQCVNLQWQWVPLWYTMCCSTVAAVSFSLVCSVPLYSVRGFLSSIKCVTVHSPWVSLWYVMCSSTVAVVSFWYAMCHATVAVGSSLLYNVSLYSGSGFLSGMQLVSLQWPWASL